MTQDTHSLAPPGRPSNSLHYAVGEISGKLDQVIAHLLPRFHSIEEVQASHHERLVGLETFRTTWLARSSLLAGVFVFITVVVQGVLHVLDIYQYFPS